ncbi:MAG: bifunctional 4-hydroxy-2-oxoglutarate aldolase/2-dehydro-3-deoxy-phosphogluconate aldolase [Chloroflexota bacterium]|nr:bifunctional 4-hydroxy-2-oxoglutarate aldolase/2-dehydro-3-deoxy-phosphogluconate aldolase [Chloroflexota bacterium]MDE2840769.1 bifunctional 4-hydroxy-2-oxoglutarate aldolase/2-dehydro-3-deoxy-phosphogluconate aldolase [Chloroflexota bacterium]
MQTLQRTRAQAQVARTQAAGMVMIIRGVPPDWAVPIGEALLAADVDVMEITLNTPHALDMIAALHDALGDETAIGAGTVLSVADAENALAAGAAFFVSPHLDAEIVRFANDHDCMVVPGAFTPTEVFTALRAGADIVKVFPANIVGPRFFRDLQGPFGEIPLLPTGGVTVENAGTYIKSGALALGVGAGLLNWQQLDGQFARVTAATRALRAAIMQARQESGKR